MKPSDRLLASSLLVALLLAGTTIGAGAAPDGRASASDDRPLRLAGDTDSLEKALDAALGSATEGATAAPSTATPPTAPPLDETPLIPQAETPSQTIDPVPPTPQPEAQSPLSTPLLPVPRSNWRPPANDDGMQPLRAPSTSRVVARNGGVGATAPGVSRPTVFELADETWVVQVMTYHYGARKRPGTIALRHDDGTLYGPWQAAGAVGQGNVPFAYWWARPAIPLKAGRYTVIDSDPATWSHEASTQGAGLFMIWERPR